MIERARWFQEFQTGYKVMRVSRATGHEVERLTSVVKGGTVNRNQDTEAKEAATLNVVEMPDLGSDLLRVYLCPVWPDGFTEDVALGTFVPSMPSRESDGRHSSAKLELSGRLSELADDAFEKPVSIPAGTNPVRKAKEIVEQCGLECIADESGAAMSTSWVFGGGEGSQGGDTKLSAVNALLDLAGFSSATTDPMGRVLLQRYREPAARAAVWAFEQGPQSRFVRKVTEERDASGVANVVKVVYSTQSGDVIGYAVDDDPRSPYSVPSRGRRVVKVYKYTNATDGITEATANRRAKSLLKNQQSVIRRVSIKHIYCPATVGDVVSLSYPDAGVDGSFTVRTQRVTLGPGCPIEAELRTFERGF